ncbi:fatty acyl-CoA reductase wat-like [Photinus pyralis]|nr:fatty acyl-CoA reductase wat-like [Photinus pyralis]
MDHPGIEEFFAGANVFLTGATGLMGKLAMEKLLRSCGDLKKLYVLVRVKKGKAVEDRFVELFENVIFDQLKKEQPDFLSKVVLIHGDCVQPNLGLSEDDRIMLRAKVNCVLHFAATVRFDQTIRTATYINVRATRDLLRLATEMPNLKSFVYMSTAYSHCVRSSIGEEFYETPITGEKLITLVGSCSEEFLDKITPTLLESWPNTYSFTKAVAEEVVQSFSDRLSVAIVRPSIVLPTAREPLLGWTDNMYGIVGLVVGICLGLIRVARIKIDCLADMVPADYCINNAIAAAWYVGEKKNREVVGNFDNRPPIFNFVITPHAPITWRNFSMRIDAHLKRVPTKYLVWYPCCFFAENYYTYMLLNILFHHIPAHLADFVMLCLGRQPSSAIPGFSHLNYRPVDGARKIDKVMNAISYFSTREWTFSDQNTQELYRQLNDTDKEKFFFDLSNFDWNQYFYSGAEGARVYILKDPLETIPEGEKRYRKLQIYHFALVTVLCLGLLWLCYYIIKLLF